MKKAISFILTLMMIMTVLPTALVSAEPAEISFTFSESSDQITSDSGGTYDVSYAFDRDFKTNCKLKSVVGGYYTIAFDGEYELSTMKIYVTYGRNDYSRVNKICVSNDGVDFTEVSGTAITASSWISTEETQNQTAARIDYTFPEGTKAKYLKITNDSESAIQITMDEIYVYGEKVVSKPKLSSLTVSGATLSPAFDPEITDYEVIFNGDITMPTFNPIVAEGLTVTSEGPDSNYVFKINVSDGSTTNTYTFKAVSTTVATNLALTYHESSGLKTNEDGAKGVDGDFSTKCSVTAKEGNYFTVKLGNGDTEYEITELKIYQDSSNNAAYPDRYKSIYVSSDGVSFTPVTYTSLVSTGSWMNDAEKTADGIPASITVKRHTITFPEGIKAKYVKIGNALTSDNEMRVVEVRVAGKLYVEKPKLSSVTVTGATLSPAFNPDTTYYTLKYDGEITVPQFSYEAPDGVTVTPSGPNAKNEFTLTATKGLGSTTYTVKAVSTIVDNDLTLKCVGHITGSTTTDAALAFDGDFTTRFEAKAINPMSNAFFTVELDDTYELSTMKLYQDSGQIDHNYTVFHDKVEISDNGVTFTDVTNQVTITATGWINNEETDNNQLVRIDYKFPAGMKAKYVKIGNYYSENSARDFRITELKIFGFVPSAKVLTLTTDKGTLSPAFDFRTTEYTLSASDLATALPVLGATATEGYNVAITQPEAKNNYVGKVEFYEDGSEDVLKTYTVTILGAPKISVDMSGIASGNLSVYSDLTSYNGDAVLILAKYDANGKLVAVKFAKSEDMEENILQTEAIAVTMAELPYIKAMMFKGFGSLEPLCKSITYADVIQ